MAGKKDGIMKSKLNQFVCTAAKKGRIRLLQGHFKTITNEQTFLVQLTTISKTSQEMSCNWVYQIIKNVGSDLHGVATLGK